MRILVDNSGYHLLNLGDIAMLQVAVSRLNKLWPQASIEVITYSCDRLAAYCPHTRAVGASFLESPLFTHLPRKIPFGLIQLHKILLPRFPALAQTWTQWQTKNGEDTTTIPETETGLLEAICGADLVIASGGGYITDSFRLHGIGVLSVLGMAIHLGKPTAMVGQGIGPLHSRLFRGDASAILPAVNFISLREGRVGPDILRSLGVAADHILVTGDDTVEMVYNLRTEKLGDSLGVNLRVAKYSGVNESRIDCIRTVIQQAARQYNAHILPIPISRYNKDSDANITQQLMIGYEAEASPNIESDLNTPDKVIKQVGHCRVIVTGSYHGAVFALSQGIPAVCLTESKYYDYKFLGLADLFGSSCYVISLRETSFAKKLREVIDQAWSSAESLRSPTLRATERQRELGHIAYQRVFDLVRL